MFNADIPARPAKVYDEIMESRREKPWHKNSSNLLVANSIFAAIAAIVIQTLAAESTTTNSWWILIGIAALIFFVVSAEKITEAFNDDDVKTYVAYFLPYNFGVLLLFIDLFVIVEHHAASSIVETILAGAVLLGGWWWGWGSDVKFLFRESKSGFKKYLDEIEGVLEPERKPGWFARSFFFLRSYTSKKEDKVTNALPHLPHLPHENVYTRLRPSKVHGVGVFAIRDIRKNTPLFSDSEDEIVWVDEKEITNLPRELREMYDDFAIIKNGKYGCPSNFNRLTMGWYLNDSDHPNVVVDDDYNMTAARDITRGEELTIDSSKFSEQPYKKK
jgi:hypothetical protein